MTIQLDHLLVPSRDRVTSAEFLAGLLGVPWSASGVGRFSPVYLNGGLTLDFDQADREFPTLHFFFRVSDAAFDAILARIATAGVPYRSDPHGPADSRINTEHGGRIVYWSEPDGHVWEMLTESYARRPEATAARA
jgi:catechol 2,3-dioxygenase-like lactoylglutathione lyase family enzyme